MTDVITQNTVFDTSYGRGLRLTAITCLFLKALIFLDKKTRSFSLETKESLLKIRGAPSLNKNMQPSRFNLFDKVFWQFLFH